VDNHNPITVFQDLLDLPYAQFMNIRLSFRHTLADTAHDCYEKLSPEKKTAVRLRYGSEHLFYVRWFVDEQVEEALDTFSRCVKYHLVNTPSSEKS